MKKTAHYALILDQSGSMFSLKNSVISNFNEQVELIQKLSRENPDKAIKITYCLFNDSIQFLHLADDFDKLTKLDNSSYTPDSCTALYDAIGTTMLHLRELKGPEDEVFLAVFTDGLENASNQYSLADIRQKLRQAENENWTIRFYCNYTDLQYFKCQLDLPDISLSGIHLNEEGMSAMEADIEFCLDNMISKKP